MRKTTVNKQKSRKPHSRSSFNWLPIDVRLLPDIFSFGQVKGVARFFLLIEIVLSVIIVSVSLALFTLRIFSDLLN